MSEETIVAVFDTANHAAQAVQALEAAGVPSNAITQHASGGQTTGSAATASSAPEKGFWASMFGGEPEHEHDTTVYDRSMASGSTVVTVKAPEQYTTQVMDILERHNPIDIDERAGSYSTSQTATTAAPIASGESFTTTNTPVTGTAAATSTAPETGAAPMGATGMGATGVSATGGEALQLSEETLSVGKRAINRGTTRIRRYVVETPVEEQVSLRDETVSIERRPVAGGGPVTNPDFTDKTIEVTETGEEAVVSKTARVKEELVIHKEVADRTETVRDTVRREDVEITKEPGTTHSTGGVADPTIKPDPKI